MSRKSLWFALPLAALGAFSVLWLSRERQERALTPVWTELRDGDRSGAQRYFDPAEVKDLPPTARRYLLHAIAPDTPLARALELEMAGTITLEPGGEPLRIEARQILAPPAGLIWQAKASGGYMRIRGYDTYAHGQGSMRWWLYDSIPVFSGDGPGITRSAATRLGAEMTMIPSTFLLDPSARWADVSESTTTVRVRIDEEVMRLRLDVDPEGRLQWVSVMRWRDDIAAYDRFDIELSDDRTFNGYTIPTRFRAGWRLGDADEHPFFEAAITRATYR